MRPTVVNVIDFLTDLFNTGLGYSGINTAKSAVSAFVTTPSGENRLGQHVLIKRFMRGVFLSRPALPRYQVTWDVKPVLAYLKTLSPVHSLTLLQLNRKLAMLFLLLSGQRCQSLHLLDIRNIRCTPNVLKITYGDLLKQTRPGAHLPELSLRAYAPDRRLCIVTVYSEYVRRTTCLRQTSRLFLSSLKPHGPASRDTLTNWIRQVMASAGIDTTVFTPHSVRGASTTAARPHVPLATILKTAGWSSSCTFCKYYQKPIEPSFSKSILDQSQGPIAGEHFD